MREGVIAATPKAGEDFAGLRVHSKLGEGGMGAAYLASHPVLKMPLVIKTFKVVDMDGVFREAQLAARVTSPHVVPVLDAGYVDELPYTTQRYIDGIDLAELSASVVSGQWRISIDALCRMILHAAVGIQAVHQAGVLHGDIKPANLFLQGDGTTAVGDFGIASDSAIDRSGAFISGSPPFMSPEQWLSAPRVESDVYSLGITAHLLATGSVPFSGSSLEILQQLHTSKSYTPPLAADPREAYLFSVIQRCLRKTPEDRYRNAESIARALRAITPPPPPLVLINFDHYKVGRLSIELRLGNLAQAVAEVIVSASNPMLAMNVGVSAALREVAGPQVEVDAIGQGPCAMGDVVWTNAGGLRARYVAHAVAALQGAVCLQRATLRVLLGTEERRCSSVALPALGTGVGGVSMDLAAKLMLEAICTFASLGPMHTQTVTFFLRDEAALQRWRAIASSMAT